MSQGLYEITSQDLNAALESVLLPRFAEILSKREPGHCMRVTDLDRDLMIRLCGGLRSRVPGATVVVLADAALRQVAPEITVSSTKLVELRNPLPDDELRPPLLVFVPNDLRASAEDSFGVATFEEISIDGAYAELIEQLLAAVPAQIKSAIEATLVELRREGARWRFADDASVVCFLLTAQRNEFDSEAIGAALFELGLIPDFELLAVPDRAPARIARNRECVEQATWSSRSERARALELGLLDPAFSRQLGEFFSRVGLVDPREWTHQIVKDRANWPLAFHRWVFEDGGSNPDTIFIGDLDLPDLPIVKDDNTDPRLAELIGHRILPISKTGLKKFSVSFRVDPQPAKVAGLSRFVAEVVSRDNGPTGLRRRKAAWAKATDSGAVSFSSLGKVDWEEGWHFVRVYAETEDGDRIPLVDEAGDALAKGTSDTAGSHPNESDLFYVLTDDDVDVEPPQRAVPREQSLTHALLQVQFRAVSQERDPDVITVSGRAWVERHARSKSVGSDTLEIKLGKEGKAHVIVSSLLADMERRFLADPEATNRLRLEILPTGSFNLSTNSFSWPDSEECRRFVDARRELFQIIFGSDQLILQGANLMALRETAENYAGAYVDWLEAIMARASSIDPGISRQALEELRSALSIDTAMLVINDYRGQRREAVLLAPTHPLRITWHTTWAHLAHRWLQQARQVSREFVVPTRDAILKQLSSVAMPSVLPYGDELGRTALAVDNLNAFWTLYAAADETDPRGLIGEVCSALSLPEPSIGGSMIDAGYLATRVQRYLIQHPYVRTLTINAFNAGRAAVLADVLVSMQRHKEFADLRYDIRLFVADPDAPGTGDALNELLSPDSTGAGREVDAFATPTESHLHPKLRLAIRSLEEFRKSPEDHSAHLSFLFDVFPAEEIRAVDASEYDECSFVHGLVQPFAVKYHEDEQSITWLRQPLHGRAKALDGAEELSDLMATLSRLMSVATGSVARSQVLPNSRPVIALSLSADERAMLHQVHEISDWVLTIDRNLGIEFFDHRRHPTRPDYLIDHSPDMANAMGHRLAITSRSIAELEALLLPLLADFGLPCTGKHAVIMLDQLRSLSGRLALKLLSSPNQRAEAMGLALSRLFLEHQGVFLNQIVVPLDAHLELYKALRQNAMELGDEVSFRRTDLALFDLDPNARLITCRLVEVKCYSQVGDLAAYEQLKASIAEQIAQTEAVLAYHFDPDRQQTDRPDRTIKNFDLATLLEFYLERSERYGLVMPDAADEARYFLRHLDDQSYRLEFTRSAIVFDFKKAGTEAPENVSGIEYYRIGRDLIEQLVESEVVETEASASFALTAAKEVSQEITQELIRRRSLAPAVPTFATAAFLGKARDRTVTWDRTDRQPYPTSDHVVKVVTLDTTDTPKNQLQEASPLLIPSNPPGLEDVQSPSTNSLAPKLPSPNVLPQSEPLSAISEAVNMVRGSAANYDIMLGTTMATPQYGLLAEVSGRKVALDLNQTHTISLFGVQGGGKSYTLGLVAEMASLEIPGINVLPEPLATVIFHYSPTMDYKPEFTSMVGSNSVEDQVIQLRSTYGADPKALEDVILLVPADKLEERKAEYPDVAVHPLQFSAAELKASHWKFLMGAVGNQATYIRQLMRVMKGMRDNITLDGLRAGIDTLSVPDHIKDLARVRLELASEYINDAVSLNEVVRPGRLIIVDLRDEFIEKDEALGLFVVLLQLFADAKIDGRSFNKLVVFDEAHKYIESPDLVAGLIEVVREMRHKGVSIMVASQDPPSVPVSLIELSSQIILHKFNSPAWLKHIQKANAALANLTPERMASLKAGEAFVWSSKATDESFSKGAVKVRCRPRVTEHGGATRVAVKEG